MNSLSDRRRATPGRPENKFTPHARVMQRGARERDASPVGDIITIPRSYAAGQPITKHCFSAIVSRN